MGLSLSNQMCFGQYNYPNLRGRNSVAQIIGQYNLHLLKYISLAG